MQVQCIKYLMTAAHWLVMVFKVIKKMFNLFRLLSALNLEFSLPSEASSEPAVRFRINHNNR